MNDTSGNQEQYRQWAPYVLIVTLLLLAYLTFQYTAPPEPSYEIPYTRFKDLASKGRVESLQLQGDIASGTLNRPRQLDRAVKSHNVSVHACPHSATSPCCH